MSCRRHAIPHWNRVGLLRQCLASLAACTDYPNSRIAIFDRGSTDGSVEFLRGLAAEVDVVFAERNVGFTHGINTIIDRYPAWDIVLLNNDTTVTAGWLQALVATATRADSIGIVGAKLVLSGELLQEAGGEVFADGRVREEDALAHLPPRTWTITENREVPRTREQDDSTAYRTRRNLQNLPSSGSKSGRRQWACQRELVTPRTSMSTF